MLEEKYTAVHNKEVKCLTLDNEDMIMNNVIRKY
jgi:hypothetical protein